MRILALFIFLIPVALIPVALPAEIHPGLDAFNRGDFAAAAKELQPLADKGDANAQYDLGLLYARGQGVSQDYQKAREWYQKAAAQGGASAAFDLGVMYDVGNGATPDYSEALKWYRQAADEGCASAMTNIGILYYNGQGVKRDLLEAYAWFARAQKFGDPRAKEVIGMASEKLTPAQMKHATAQVDAWQPTAKPSQPVVAKVADTKVADAQVPDAAPAAPENGSPRAAPPNGAPKQQGADRLAPQDADRLAPAGADHLASAGADRSASAGADRLAPEGADRLVPKAAPQPADPAVWTGVDRIVAVGGINGDYEQFALVLESAGLIDGNGNWTGGKTHLVQTGDILGPESSAVMDLLIRLEKQAAQAGGAVHCLMGSHEAEMQSEFGPEDAYGKWLRGRNAMVKIDRTLFVHAGIGPKYADWSIGRINLEVRRELTGSAQSHDGIASDEQGPLSFPGLAKGSERELKPLVEQLLKNFDVDRIVVGQSYANGAVTPRFEGNVILVDVGISRVSGNSAVACLEIAKDQAFALHRGQKLALPKDDNGPGMLRYLEAAAALDPQPSPLAARIEEMEKK